MKFILLFMVLGISMVTPEIKIKFNSVEASGTYTPPPPYPGDEDLEEDEEDEEE